MVRRSTRRHGAACIAFLIFASAPALRGQDALGREIAFVRALAKEMSLIELAKAEADRLAGVHRGAKDQDKIAQLAVEIAYYGARARSDRAQQRALFKETIDKSRDLVDRSSDKGVQLEALTTLANASQDFGQFLIEELDIAREETPDQVKELETEAAQVLRTGIEACTKVKEALSAQRSDPQKEVEYYLMWMKKAVLTREQARADRDNRKVLIERAIDELTEMVLEVGEETAIGLRGLFEIAQCQEVGGQINEAISSYRDTLTQIATSLKQAEAGELELSGEMQSFLFDMLQEVYVRAGEVMARQGAEGTAQLFQDFREHMARFGEKGADLFDVVSPTYGHLMLLAESRFKAESGDPKKVKEALAMAQRINDKHPNDYIGVRSKAVLRDILELQQSLVSGSLLVEVAKGELQNRNYEEAVKGLRRALAALSAEEQAKLGLDCYRMLGQSYAATDRHLEAMLALIEGLRRFGTQNKELASDLADALDRTMTLHKRTTRTDAFFEPFWRDTADEIAKWSTAGASKLSWKTGNDLFLEQKYAEAAAEFAKVTEDFLNYEQARVRMARAQSAGGDYAGARKTLADYRAWAAQKELPARDAARQQIRAAAMLDAEFNELQMAYNEARGNDEFKLPRNLEAYPAAIERAQAFLTNAKKDAETYVPIVLEYVGRLHTDLSQLDRAEAAYVQLKQADAVRASRLATEIFREYLDRVKLLSGELDQAIAKDKGDRAIAAATQELNGIRQKLCALGLDYANSSPKPQLGILVATMQNYEQLGDWKHVDDVAQKTLALYGNETEETTKRVVDQLVRPMIGEALLQQQRFQEAYDMLVAAEQANPQQWELKRQIARALGGWFEFSKTGTPVKVPGLDRAEEAYMKYYGDRENAYRVWATRPEVKQFSLEWYRFMWESYWFAKQAGAKNSKFKETADKLFRQARSTNDFATLKQYGAEGDRILRYFQANR